MRHLLTLAAWIIRLTGLAIATAFCTSFVLLIAFMVWDAWHNADPVEIAGGLGLVIVVPLVLVIGVGVTAALFDWASKRIRSN